MAVPGIFHRTEHKEPSSRAKRGDPVEYSRKSGLLRQPCGFLAMTMLFAFILMPVQKAYAVCANPAGDPGQMMFNTSFDTMQYCDDTDWIDMAPAADITSNLQGHWKFDETSGTSTADSSTNTNTGTLRNATTTMQGPQWNSGGVIDGAIEFEGGADVDNVNLPYDASLEIAGDMTIAGWIKTSSTAYGDILHQTTSPEFKNYGFALGSSGTLKFIHGNSTGPVDGATYDSVATVNDGAWHHVAFVADYPNGHFYVDGTNVKTVTMNFDITLSSTNNAYNFSNLSGSWNYVGLMDDFRLYSRALSPSDVAAIARMGSPDVDLYAGLVGHWTMDETSGTVVADSAGGDNDATLKSGTISAAATSKIGGAVQFSAVVDEYFQMAVTAAIKPTAAITVATWVRADALGSYGLVRSSDSGGWNEGWRLITDGSSDFAFRLDTDTSAPVESGTAGSSEVLIASQWQHIAGTYDGTDIKFYLDGVLIESNALSGNITYTDPGQPLGEIGHSNGVPEFDGAMDDVRIYDRALTADEVAVLSGGGNCANPSGGPGHIIYNSSSDVMQFCDGMSWAAMGDVPGAGGAGCSNPTGTTGHMVYNTTFNIMQFCDGTDWIGIGK